MPSREITSSRGKTLVFLLLSLGFVSVAAFLPNDGTDQTWRWLCGGLFGLGSIIFAVLLIRPQRLLLDQHGFAIDGGLRRSPRRVAWADVDRFIVYRLPRGGKVAGYLLTDAARPDTYWGDMNRHFGADGVLPRTLPGSVEELAATLSDYRARVLAAAAAFPLPQPPGRG